MPIPSKTLLLADIGPIAAAQSGVVYPVAAGFRVLPPLAALVVFADFAYGSGGTTAKAWLQGSIDGTNWMDIANFAFTTAAARRLFSLGGVEGNGTRTTGGEAALVPTQFTPGDAALADNTAINGVMFPIYRVKFTSTGTYAGATSLKIYLYGHTLDQY